MKEMKSIGIFGDSFCGYQPNPSYEKYHWAPLLGKYFNCEIKNYGQPGSSLYYSYQEFIKNYYKQNLNIFLVTNPDRYPVKVRTSKNVKEWVSNIRSLDYIKNTSRIIDPPEVAIRGWFIASDLEYNREMSNLMIDKILNLDSTVIIFPCYFDSLNEEMIIKLKLDKEMCMDSLQIIQAKAYDVSIETTWDFLESEELINGHLCPELNAVFFEIIKNRILTKKWHWDIPENINYKYKLEELWWREK